MCRTCQIWADSAAGGTYRAIDSPILSDFPIEADLQSLSLPLSQDLLLETHLEISR